MAYMFKTIKRHKGIEYVWSQNYATSKYSYIEGYDRKTNQLLGSFLEVNNRTLTVIPLRETPSIVIDLVLIYLGVVGKVL